MDPAAARSPLATATPSRRWSRLMAYGQWAVPLIYLMSGSLWILGSDNLIATLTGAPDRLAGLQTLKGLLYVLATAALLYLLLRPLLRRLTESHQLLEASEQRYRSLFFSNPVPMWIYAPESLEILAVNDAALAFHGSRHEEFLALRLPALWPEQDGARLAEHLAAARAASGPLPESMHRLRTRSGGYRDVVLFDCPADTPEQPARLVAVHDRTAELQALHELEQTSRRLREAQSIAGIGYWELNPATGYGHFSDELYRLIGRQPPDSPGWRPLGELFASPSSAPHLQCIEQRLSLIRLGLTTHVDDQFAITDAAGETRRFLILADSFEDGTGRPMVRGILQDITRTAPTEGPDLPFRRLVEVMPDGLLVLEGERAIFANPAFRLEFGLGEDPLTEVTLPALVVEDDRERFVHWLRQTPAEGEVLLLTPAPLMHRRDHSVFRAGIVQQVARHDGRIYRLLFVRDLSDAERMRDALAAGNAELQALARRLFSLQEDERRAISRDLHDDIGQAITAMKLSAHAAMDDEDPATRREELDEIVALADATVVKLRDISTLLRPPQLDALGLEASIRWQAGRLLRSSDIALDLQLTPLPARPAREVEQACFRIAQECLTNVVRHAHAGHVEVSLRDMDGQWLELRVRDDGDGFEPAAAAGLGLVVMRERAQGVGGLLKMHTAPGAGTTVELRLPYQPSAASPD